MKQLFRHFIGCLLILVFSVQVLGLYAGAATICTSVLGSQRNFRIYWCIPCFEAIGNMYPIEKLSIKLEPYFISDSVKLDSNIPAKTLRGSDLYEESHIAVIDCTVEVPYRKDWSLNVAATVSYGEKVLIRDTLVLGLSDEVTDPLQFIDTTVIDFPIYRHMSDEICDKVRESSVRNRVVMDLFCGQRDSVLLAGLKQLPQDEALTYYLKALRLAHRKHIDYEFNRHDDPDLLLPRDSIVFCDSVTIQKLNLQIADLKSNMEIDRWLSLDCSELEAELNSKLSLLEELEQGRNVVYYAYYGLYDVLSEYLDRCFQKDSSFIRIALLDPDIPRDVLKEVLKEKYINIYHPYETYVCPKVAQKAYRLKQLKEKKKSQQIEKKTKHLLKL